MDQYHAKCKVTASNGLIPLSKILFSVPYSKSNDQVTVLLPMLQSKIAGKTSVSVQLSFAVKLPKAIVAHQRPWWLIKAHDGSSKAMMASSINQ